MHQGKGLKTPCTVVKGKQTNGYLHNKCTQQANRKKIRHDWVELMVPRDLCKRLQFSHAKKLYMQERESIFENEMQEIIRDFKITNSSPNSDSKSRPSINELVLYILPFQQTIEWKAKTKRQHMSGFCWRAEKFQNMKVTMRAIAVGDYWMDAIEI